MHDQGHGLACGPDRPSSCSRMSSSASSPRFQGAFDFNIRPLIFERSTGEPLAACGLRSRGACHARGRPARGTARSAGPRSSRVRRSWPRRAGRPPHRIARRGITRRPGSRGTTALRGSALATRRASSTTWSAGMPGSGPRTQARATYPAAVEVVAAAEALPHVHAGPAIAVAVAGVEPERRVIVPGEGGGLPAQVGPAGEVAPRLIPSPA